MDHKRDWRRFLPGACAPGDGCDRNAGDENACDPRPRCAPVIRSSCQHHGRGLAPCRVDVECSLSGRAARPRCRARAAWGLFGGTPQESLDCGGKRLRHRRPIWLRPDHGRGNLRRVLASERASSGQHYKHDATKRPHVGAPVSTTSPRACSGLMCMGGAHPDDVSRGERRWGRFVGAVGQLENPCQSEIGTRVPSGRNLMFAGLRSR